MAANTGTRWPWATTLPVWRQPAVVPGVIERRVPNQARIVWSLFQSRKLSPEEAAVPTQELFVPVAADGESYADFPEAFAAGLRLIESEGWEVGVIVRSGGGAQPWQLCWLEPASPFQRRDVVAGASPGFEWVRARPPRREQVHALHELRQQWTEDEGRRGYAIEREVLTLADLARITLDFRGKHIY
jgi:hypothetical protein